MKWKGLILERGKLVYKKKLIVPQEEATELMKLEITKNGAPMTSRDSLFKYMFQKYWGIKKHPQRGAFC